MSWSRYATGYSTGNASDTGLLMFPRHYNLRSVKRAVILLHGSVSIGVAVCTQWDDVTGFPKMSALARQIVDAGYPCFSPNMDGPSCGNDTAITRIGEAITYVQGTLGCKSGTVILMGTSFGGQCALAYARAHPANVACIVGMLPLSDLNDFYTNRATTANKASIDAAYGGAWSEATYGATHSPKDFASQLTMPYQAWSASDDTLIVPSTVAAVAAAYGGSIDTHNALTGGHSDAAIGQIPVSSVLSFLATHA